MAATDLQLFADVNPSGGSAPADLTPIGSTLYFSAASSGTNRELWKINAAGGPATLVKEINPSDTAAPLQLTNINGTLYFTANDGTNGRELWKSDGTPDGTVRLTNLHTASDSFGATATTMTDFAVIGNSLFFRARDNTHGYELWKYDTVAGTSVQVGEINPAGASAPSYLTVVDQTLYFAADTGTSVDLWKTDAAGTAPTRVKEINALGDDGVAFITALGNTIYFQANNGTNGAELWKSNGTDVGTVMVKDIRPGPNTSSSFPNQLTVIGNTIYMSAIDLGANRELWKSDGTELGTVKVKEINATGAGGVNSANPSFLTNVGGTLFFTATDGTNNELWKSNGTDAGTVRVSSTHVPLMPMLLTNVGGTLYFSGTGPTVLTSPSPNTGIELWTSDGTDAGTRIVKDLEPNAGSSSPTEITSLGGRLVIAASTTATSSELWRQPPIIAGDFNQDSAVDGADFLKWQQVFGTADAATDPNNDGIVNNVDLAIWDANYGLTSATSAAAFSSAGSSTSALAAVTSSNVILSSDMFVVADNTPTPALPQAVVANDTAAHDAALSALASPSPSSSVTRRTASPAEPTDREQLADTLWADWPASSLGEPAA